MSIKILMASLLSLGMLAGCAGSETKPAAPAKSAARSEAKVVDAKADVTAAMAAVNSWASAWQARDVSKYLGAYAPDFKPEKGTRAEWQKQRQQRVGKAKEIKVTLNDVQIKSSAADRATATFTQSYKSDSYSDKGKKALDLKLIDGKWMITREYKP